MVTQTYKVIFEMVTRAYKVVLTWSRSTTNFFDMVSQIYKRLFAMAIQQYIFLTWSLNTTNLFNDIVTFWHDVSSQRFIF